MGVLSQLQPKAVFEYFEKLCAVPHGSGNTKIISDLCVGFAKELGLKYRQDELNNLVIWKEATAGYENAEPIILQGHLDMVCAKTADCTKDMAKEGLDIATDGEYIWAEKTSLGGDDGVAVAMALAILADDTLPHPALEAVFTVDEEVGMNGAAGMDCSDLKGRKLLNIDSEVEGVFTVSCAGGVRCDCFLPGERAPLAGEVGYTVKLSGLLGGHSGMEINKGRASANHLMGRVLYMAAEQVEGLRLEDITGGDFDNVISSCCAARVAVPAAAAAAFESFVTAFEAAVKNEYAAGDPKLSLCCERAELTQAFDAASSCRMLGALFATPQGVQEMSLDFPGLVQTSLNLGVIRAREDGIFFTFSVRSNIESQKELLRQKLHCIARSVGGKVSERSNYPGWQYNRESAFRETVLAAYRDLGGKDERIEAIHAGLECGLFIEKMPGLDAISLGPNILDIHSVNEKLDVASVERVYALVCEVLKRSK